MEKEIIIYDEAKVEFRNNISGWVAPDGRFFGNNSDSEHMARWHACTHKRCGCGGLMTKGWTLCKACLSKKSIENYSSLPSVNWDGKCLISYNDTYFTDFNDVIEYALENDIESIHNMCLYPTSKKFVFTTIDIDSINEDYGTEDLGFSHFHPEIAKFVDELNHEINSLESKLWFTDGSKKLNIPIDVEEEFQRLKVEP